MIALHYYLEEFQLSFFQRALLTFGILSKAFVLLCVSNVTYQNVTYANDLEAVWAPEKTITVMAPSNPGGGWDQTARFLQRAIIVEGLSKASVEVINRGGAGGTIGLTETVNRYDGDPYKLMIGGFTMTGASIMHGSPHSLLDTTLIARLTSEYQALAVPYDSSIQTLEDLTERFRANPTSITWGGGSAGSADQIFASLLAEEIGVPATHVTYVAFTGGGEAAAALMGGQVDVGISGFAELAGLAEAKRIRLLAISAPNRSVSTDLPTFRELGVDIVFENWRGIVAPPGITEAEKAWYTRVITAAHKSATWQDVLARNNWQDSFLTGEAFEAFVQADILKTKGVLSRMGLGSGGEGYAEVGPYFFPRIIAIALALMGILLGYSYISKQRLNAHSLLVEEPTSDLLPSTRQFLIAIGILAAYLTILPIFGFLLSTPFFILSMSHTIGSRTPIRDLTIGIALTVIITFVFEELINVDIP